MGLPSSGNQKKQKGNRRKSYCCTLTKFSWNNWLCAGSATWPNHLTTEPGPERANVVMVEGVWSEEDTYG